MTAEPLNHPPFPIWNIKLGCGQGLRETGLRVASQGCWYRPRFTAGHGLPASGTCQSHKPAVGTVKANADWNGVGGGAVNLAPPSQRGCFTEGKLAAGEASVGTAPPDHPHPGVQTAVFTLQSLNGWTPVCLSPSCKGAGQAASNPP